jgi:chemosensory pili system protein ChpA (sensor histidine kinase/response regulator)
MTQFSHASAAPPFDTGPLSWVIGEIRDALERSAKALQDAAGRAPEAQPTLLLHAKSHLHQAHGALQMVDVAGVERLGEAAEQVARPLQGRHAGARRRSAPGPWARRTGRSSNTWKSCWTGRRRNPVRLFPYYRALQELLGVERVHPGEMLVLDLAPHLLTELLPGAGAGPSPDYAAPRRIRKGAAAVPEVSTGTPSAPRRPPCAMHWRASCMASRRRKRMRSGWRCRPSPTSSRSARWPPTCT